MRIAVIGNDINGLLAAHMIAKQGHEPVIYHEPGRGVNLPEYDRSLELKRKVPGLGDLRRVRTIHAMLLMEFQVYMNNLEPIEELLMDFNLVFGPEEFEGIETIGPDPNDVVPQVLGVLTGVGLAAKEE
jgi:hypothetical protein